MLFEAALKQRNTHLDDGLDIGLCIYHIKQQKIQFSGAKVPLFYVMGGTPYLLKPDRLSIGGLANTSKEFTLYERDVEAGSVFYLYSDGFQDQIGGPKNKKFYSRNFRKLLLDVHDRPMQEQKEVLISSLERHIGEGQFKQVDDITILGFRPPVKS